jgi:hypothetical protein
VTVAVAVPAAVPDSTVHVHETVPVESATCFLLSPGARDSFPEWYFTLTWHVAPGEVTTVSVRVELAATEAGRLVMSTESAIAVELGVGPAEVGAAAVGVPGGGLPGGGLPGGWIGVGDEVESSAVAGLMLAPS